MRRFAIIFCTALMFAMPTVARAQYNDNDQQNPKEYHDEDSQPLAIVADVLYPIGYAAEWLIARPMHYLANDSPAAPAFRPVGGNDTTPMPPVPVIPDNTMASEPAQSTPQDWSPTRTTVTTTTTTTTSNRRQGSAAAPSGSQPALH
jgi:hypothetical protein